MDRLAAPLPGRSCPSSYRYAPGALAGAPALRVQTLWVAGGLYGNPFALESLIASYEREPGEKALVFNGDFHWFDAQPREFEAITGTVLSFHATRGNVETELFDPAPGAGCGCAYPDWVDHGTVERSNAILERLRAAARAVPQALAGWGFSQEALATPAGYAAAARAFLLAGVDVFASSHTCLPVLQAFWPERALINNGAAGMPNFRGALFGLATRIALKPSDAALYRARVGGAVVEAVPVPYDAAAWERHFTARWPAGSAAHVSYHRRIVAGPDYDIARALR